MGKDYGSGVIIESAIYWINNGEKITAPIVNLRGVLNVSSGGTATQIVENGGAVILNEGAEVSFTTNTFSNLTIFRTNQFLYCATVHSCTTANCNTVISGGELHISAGGTAYDTVIGSEGRMIVSAWGTADSTTVNEGGILTVLHPGNASNTTINSKGSMIVSYGATATNTTVNSGGSMIAVGTANDTTITNGGAIDVCERGIANRIIVVEGGHIIVRGGEANSVTLNDSKATISVSNGGVANSITVNAGNNWVENGGSMNETTINNGGTQSIMLGGSANSTTVNSGGKLYVSSGGVATNLVLSDGAIINLYLAENTFVQGKNGNKTFNMKDGALSGFVVNNKCTLEVFDYGSASQTMVSSGGTMCVSRNGTANKTTVSSGGMMYVSYGGTATDTTVSKGGALLVSGVVNNTTIFSGGGLGIVFGGVVNNATISSGGHLTVSNSGNANSVTIKNSGSMIVAFGGIANETTVKNGGILDVSAGVVTNTLVNSGGSAKISGSAENTTINKMGDELAASLTVFNGGKTTSTTINSMGYMHISNGGQATSTTVDYGGVLNVSNGGQATSSFIKDGGRIDVFEGGLASGARLSSGGVLNVSNGGTAQNTFLYGGNMYASNGATVASAMALQGATLYVYEGAMATGIVESGGYVSLLTGASATFLSNTFSGLTLSNASATVHAMTEALDITLNQFGSTTVYSGGRATGLTVNDYGRLEVLSGAHLGGSMTFEDGAVVKVSSGAVVHFDISGPDGPSNTAIINNLAKIGTAPDYMLTVGGALQKEGAYMLAMGAAGFDKTISVVNTYGTEIGVLTVGGGALEFSGVSYTLNLDGYYLWVSAWNKVFTGDVTSETKNIFAGMSAVNVNVNEKGILNISSGGVASSTNVNAGGSMNLFDGGAAGDTTVNQGVLHIKSGGLANDTDIYYAIAKVSSGGIANGTTVNQDGDLILDYKGTASDTTVNKDGHFEVSNGGMAADTTVNKGGHLYVYSGGTATSATVNAGGTAEVSSGGMIDGTIVNSGGSLLIYNGARLTGRMTFESGATVIPFVGSILDFDLTQTSAGSVALVNDLSILMGTPTYTLTVSATQANGTYNLAEGAAGFNKTISVVNTSGTELGTLTVGQTVTIGGVDYTLNLTNDALSVTVGAAVVTGTAKSDIDGNGISDVMFIWTGNNYAHGYWMNGTSTWQSANSNHPAEWDNLGCYDMTGDGKADSVLFGNVTSEAGIHGAYIGYYADANDLPDGSTWVNIGYLTNEDDIQWKNVVGNLTGNESGANSIVWYTYELGALGAWTDGTENWVSIGTGFDAGWTLIGCGDFSGDGRDQVVMAYNSGTKYYAYAIDGSCAELGDSDSGWEVRAIGDFAGDGKDDIVAFHKETGIVAIWGDGLVSNWSQLGQLDAKDWFVVGAGDYNGDEKDDLLVRQISTGMLGYYSGGSMANWVELGRGVDMDWTVIA